MARKIATRRDSLPPTRHRNPQPPTRRTFTRDERVAMGELFRAAAMCATSGDDAVLMLGAVMAERAANIWRGEETPCVATAADLRTFAEVWDVKTRAVFNPRDLEPR